MLFFVVTAAFSSAGSLLFGSVSLSMRTTWSAALAVVAMATGIYSPPDLQADGSPWFSVFSVFCSVLGCGLLTAYVSCLCVLTTLAPAWVSVVQCFCCEICLCCGYC